MKWHGYITLKKPDGYTDEQWQSAIVGLRLNLDETPNSPQPAQRWHEVTKGECLIAEATFDRSKLRPDYLAAIVGAPMHDRFKALGHGLEWRRSKEIAHKYMSDDWNWELMQKTFYPEDYGADGTPQGNTTAIQAAIDAAGQSGGGQVRLSGFYAITRQGNTDLGQYTNCDYCLWIRYNNVSIVGPGVLVLESVPIDLSPGAGLAMLLFGIGGGTWIEGQDPWGLDGTWIENVECRNVVFDCTALSEDDKEILRRRFMACPLSFCYCRNFRALHNRFLGGYAWDGVLATHYSSREGSLIGNHIIGSNRQGIRIDGAEYVYAAGNRIEGAQYGFVVGTNNDNWQSSNFNIIEGNWIMACEDGGIILTQGSRNLISNNTLYSVGPWAIRIKSDSGVLFGQAANYNSIIGNRIESPGRGIAILGWDYNQNWGGPMQCSYTFISGNYLDPSLNVGIQLGEQATHNVFSGNYNGAIHPTDIAPTAVENVGV